MDSDISLEEINYSLDPFTVLSSIGKCFEKQEIECAIDVNSICSGNEAIITILCYDEVINLKVTIDERNLHDPLIAKTCNRIKNVSGRKIIANQTSTFLLSNNGKLSKFKSSRSLKDVTSHTSVIYLNCFCGIDEKCSFLVISLEDNSRVVLQLYDELFEAEYIVPKREIDLITKKDQILTIENDFDVESILQDYIFSSEFVEDIQKSRSTLNFFNAFLNIDAKKKCINDILLLSCNDRLLFLKFRDDLGTENMTVDQEEEESLISIEQVLISKGKIRAIKFFNNSLLMVDDFWMLTMYFYCSSTRIVKKKEIQLIGNVTCFRFTDNYFIYSNESRIIFIRFRTLPEEEPDTFEVNLSMIITFTVIQKFLLAIDKNHFFYYVPIRQFHDQVQNNNEYQRITDADIFEIPRAIHHLKLKEKSFRLLTEEVQYESKLNILLDHLLENTNFDAGSAEIEFLSSLPHHHRDSDIVCKPTNSRSGRTYIKINLKLNVILKTFKFTIAFYRRSISGTLVRNIDVINEKNVTEFSIFVPAELEDNPKNQMEVFVHFNFSSSSDKHVLQFPMKVTQVKKDELYNSVAPTEIDGCFNALTDLIKRNNL